MLRKAGRLFTIKTRWEAWLVIYAIALGAVERGRHYLETYPGWAGWMLALACTGVVFVAGAKLLYPPESRHQQLQGFRRVHSRRRSGAGHLLVVVDPRSGVIIPPQSHAFHIA